MQSPLTRQQIEPASCPRAPARCVNHSQFLFRIHLSGSILCRDREGFVAWLLRGLPALPPPDVTIYAVTDPSGRVAHTTTVEPAEAVRLVMEQPGLLRP